LTSSTQAVDVNGSDLRLDPKIVAFLSAVKSRAREGGFQARTPMIDLSGRNPGVLYALGARPLGAAWLLGGLVTSDQVASMNLDVVPCEQMARAWILDEPDGPRRLSPGILNRHGMNLRRDFELAGRFNADFPSINSSQELFKPDRSPEQAKAACERARVG
jgi:hypothetical protein